MFCLSSKHELLKSTDFQNIRLMTLNMVRQARESKRAWSAQSTYKAHNQASPYFVLSLNLQWLVFTHTLLHAGESKIGCVKICQQMEWIDSQRRGCIIKEVQLYSICRLQHITSIHRHQHIHPSYKHTNHPSTSWNVIPTDPLT